MAVIRPIRLSAVAQGSSPTAIADCALFSWRTQARVLVSKSDGDIGITTAVVSGWEVAGSLGFLNHQTAAGLALLGIVKLVLTYKAAGGATRTRTFGTTADGSGVRFGRVQEIPFAEGGREGAQTLFVVPWRGVWKSTYTLPSDFMTMATL